MWINKKAYKAWAEEVRALQGHLKTVIELAEAFDRDKDKLREQLERAEASLQAALLRETEVRGQLRTARAYSDTWRLQLNHLQLQTAEFLARLLPGYSVRSPQIEMQAEFLPPGLDFEDLGDDRAHHFGYAPEHPMAGQPANVPQRPRPEDGLERMDEPTPLLDPQEG